MGDDAAPVMPAVEYETETLRLARAGDRGAAFDAIDLCISALQAHSVSPAICDYLATALSIAIQDPTEAGQDAWLAAFNLRPARHRPSEPDRTLDRDLNVAVWVHFARARGMALKAAKETAGQLFGVENIDRTLRNVGAVDSADEAHYDGMFQESGTPLPLREPPGDAEFLVSRGLVPVPDERVFSAPTNEERYAVLGRPAIALYVINGKQIAQVGGRWFEEP